MYTDSGFDVDKTIAIVNKIYRESIWENFHNKPNSIRNLANRARELKNDFPNNINIGTGLCRNLASHSMYDSLLISIFSKWEKYSGDESYPVPDSLENINRDTDSHMCKYGTTTNMYEGEYGKLRLELLDFLIAVLDRMVIDMLSNNAKFNVRNCH